MDTFSPSLVLFADRPLLGAVAFAACLAGGTSAQNLAAVPQGGLGPSQAGPALGYVHDAAIAAPSGLAAAAARPGVSVALPAPRYVPATVRPAPAPIAKTAQPPAEPPLVPAAAAPLVAAAAAPLPLSAAPAAAIDLAPALAPAVIAAPAELVAAAPLPVQPLVPAVTAPASAAPLALVTSPELRAFDLAKYRRPAPRQAGLAASRKAAPVAGKPASASARSRAVTRMIDDVVFHQTAISVAGQAGGDIAVRIGPDMKPSVKVGDLLGLVSAQMDPDALARFSLASGAQDYVSFAALRSAGFDVQYNAAADSIAISVAP